jgi:hypothetical protein
MKNYSSNLIFVGEKSMQVVRKIYNAVLPGGRYLSAFIFLFFIYG